jgi:hypothetical protein
MSIFFGHLWIVGMRNQIANDYFDYSRSELIWPERLQYCFFFIVALCGFVVLRLSESSSGRSSPLTSYLADNKPLTE